MLLVLEASNISAAIMRGIDCGRSMDNKMGFIHGELQYFATHIVPGFGRPGLARVT
jgi:hypothetical protein